MKWLTLEGIKAHLRIDHDYEDTLLEQYGTAAENGILKLCNRSYENIVETYGEEDVTSNLTIAALLLTEHLYTHRGPTENVNISIIPYGVDFWVKPYIRLAGCSC